MMKHYFLRAVFSIILLASYSGVTFAQASSDAIKRITKDEFDQVAPVIGQIDFEIDLAPCVSEIDFSLSANQCVVASDNPRPELGTFYSDAFIHGVHLQAPHHPNRSGFIFSLQFANRNNPFKESLLEDQYAAHLVGGNDISLLGLGRNKADSLGAEIINISFEHTKRPTSFGLEFGSIEGPTPCCVRQKFVFEMSSGAEHRYEIGPNSKENGSVGFGTFSGFHFENDTIEKVYLAQVGHQSTIDNMVWGGSKRPLYILFVNGIWTSEEEAERSRDALKNLLVQSVPENLLRDSEVKYLYNPSNGISDLYEVFVQRNPNLIDTVSEFFSRIGDWLSNEDQFERGIRDITEEQMSINLLDSAFRDVFSDFINEEVESGKSVLVVPYSQGNLYALEVNNKLDERIRKHVSFVGVATPAEITPNSSPYVIDRSDLVIRPLPRTLPHNAENLVTSLSDIPNYFLASLGHSFDLYYLRNDTDTEQKFLERFTSELIELNTVGQSEEQN